MTRDPDAFWRLTEKSDGAPVDVAITYLRPNGEPFASFQARAMVVPRAVMSGHRWLSGLCVEDSRLPESVQEHIPYVFHEGDEVSGEVELLTDPEHGPVMYPCEDSYPLAFVVAWRINV